MMRTTPQRECRKCGAWFIDRGPGSGIPRHMCSKACAEKTKAAPKRTVSRRSGAVSPASPSQREKVADMACLVCRQPGVDPAHLVPRSVLSEGQDDPRAVVPLCRTCHRDAEENRMDLLPYLEPWYRTELAFAVERFGLARTYDVVTGGSSLIPGMAQRSQSGGES